MWYFLLYLWFNQSAYASISAYKGVELMAMEIVIGGVQDEVTLDIRIMEKW